MPIGFDLNLARFESIPGAHKHEEILREQFAKPCFWGADPVPRIAFYQVIDGTPDAAGGSPPGILISLLSDH
jgi:hypothetical protein